MASEKIEKQLEWALAGREVDNLDLTEVIEFWEEHTDRAWNFAGDSFDTLGLPGLSLPYEHREKFLALIHKAATSKPSAAAKPDQLNTGTSIE